MQDSRGLLLESWVGRPAKDACTRCQQQPVARIRDGVGSDLD